jgi:spermidine synthase
MAFSAGPTGTLTRYNAVLPPAGSTRLNRDPAETTALPATANTVAAAVYLVAFVTGAIVMGFEMLGSRYLNPYFGSGIYTWAALISTVLIALTAGYFLGGALADRTVSLAVLAATVLTGSVYLLILPSFAEPVLEFVLAKVDDVRTGSLLAALAIMAFPVALLGMYSPFAIRLLLRSASTSGRVSGTVYGISTAGSIAGTLGTTFFLIPAIGSRAITLTFGAIGACGALLLLALARLERRRANGLMLAVLTVTIAAPASRAEPVVDEAVRAAMLTRPDGRLAHIETEYNDIFVTKRGAQLTMSFQLKGWDYTESVVNLADPDDLPIRYTQVMTLAAIYPPEPRSILMLGLGGGSISTYLGRRLPDASITTIELDPGVIGAAKTYFGVIETPRMRYRDSDARVFLNRNSETYDLILVDAYRGGYVPFHLLTREFYALAKRRLAPGGAIAFNVHDGTKLYASTVRTLTDVFPALDLYSTGLGEVIAVAAASPAISRDALAARATALQDRHGFRYPLPDMLKRLVKPPAAAAKADLITDDFAPADVYDVMGERIRNRK